MTSGAEDTIGRAFALAAGGDEAAFTRIVAAHHDDMTRVCFAIAGDLDLIAWEGDTLCFIEVKTRTTRVIATAEAAVDEDKRRTLRRLARSYMRQLPSKETAARFDILSIYFEKEKAAEFELFRGAFDWS